MDPLHHKGTYLINRSPKILGFTKDIHSLLGLMLELHRAGIEEPQCYDGPTFWLRCSSGCTRPLYGPYLTRPFYGPYLTRPLPLGTPQCFFTSRLILSLEFSHLDEAFISDGGGPKKRRWKSGPAATFKLRFQMKTPKNTPEDYWKKGTGRRRSTQRFGLTNTVINRAKLRRCVKRTAHITFY